ncbi:MAG: 2-phospho-L-lactate guanylyltransferase [Euryarchaeota archaeon]|nr:2-phospho-L-lactate guanylyltransferase [Euryarchaeota archaeon]
MKIFAIIPIAKLTKGKSRLTSTLNLAQRKQLILVMLRDILRAISKTNVIDKIIIVTPETSLENFLSSAIFLKDDKNNIDEAVAIATNFAVKNGADATLFLPGDIPLLQPIDIEKIVSLSEENSIVISPSKDGGTSALLRMPANIIGTKFGKNSLVEHIKRAYKKRVKVKMYLSQNLTFDVDEPADLEKVLQNGKGTSTSKLLKEFKINYNFLRKPLLNGKPK